MAYLQQQHRSSGHCFLHCNGIPSWQLLQDLRSYAATPLERKQMGHLAVGGERISIAGETVVSCLHSWTVVLEAEGWQGQVTFVPVDLPTI